MLHQITKITQPIIKEPNLQHGTFDLPNLYKITKIVLCLLAIE